MNDGFNMNYDNQKKENEINKGKDIFGVSEIKVYEVILQ